jgi:two-component system response regulator YesN
MNSLILQTAAQKVIAAKKHAEENFRSEISVSRLCNDLKIPQDFFLRFFNDTEKTGFNDYVNSLRIENAKKLLKETMLDDEVVAMRSGFTDYVFYKLLFRQSTNLLPAEFRKKYYSP